MRAFSIILFFVRRRTLILDRKNINMDRKSKNHKGSRENYNRKSRPRKRKFYGDNNKTAADTKKTSRASKKLKNSECFDVCYDRSVNYAFISFTHFFLTLSTFVKCKDCDGDIKFVKTCAKSLGLQVSLRCMCKNRVINSCNRIGNDYEINRKFVFVMRLIGVGVGGIKLFCSIMDLGQDITNARYYGIIENIKFAVKTVYDMVLKKAGLDEKKILKEKNLPEDRFAVSGDGT